MKAVNFTSLRLENFCTHQDLTVRFGKKTLIKGVNGCGKSTMKQGILYALGCKDESGKEISGIRPHDKNGVDIDGLTTVSELSIYRDGLENSIKKVYKQKKNRQGEYTGENDTQYFIDDVRKSTKKDYDGFIQSFLPSGICINARDLLAKDTAERREILKKTFGKHSIEDIVAENPEFESLLGKLKVNSVEDLKKSCRKKIKDLKADLTKTKHEIEFEQGRKKDIDIAELELHKNSLKERISRVESEEADISKQYKKYDELSNGVLELNFKLSDLERKANEGLHKQALELEKKRLKLSEKEEYLNFEKRRQEGKRGNKLISLEKAQAYLEGFRRKWKVENERVFDENNLVCSYCGQEYPGDKKDAIRAEFEKHKAEKLSIITENGNAMKQDIDDCRESIKKCDERIGEIEKELAEIGKELSGLEAEQGKLPDYIDISGTAEYQEIKAQIEEKEAAMIQMGNTNEFSVRLAKKKMGLQSELTEVEIKLREAAKNNEIDGRIAELQKQQRELGQKIADCERELYLLESFEMKQAEVLEEDINSNMKFVKFKMFKKLVNGELAPICSPFVDGTSYDGNLNTSNKLLAEIDICLAFQRFYGVQLPVLLDNAESVDEDRIPDIPNQLIIFEKTKDKELKIEVE